MRRLTFISAALLASAMAIPAFAQDSSGGTPAQPPIMQQPDAGAAATADRPTAQSGSDQNAAGAAQTDGTAAAGTEQLQTGQSGSSAGSTDAPATDGTAAAGAEQQTGQSGTTAGTTDAPATDGTAADAQSTQPAASEDTAGASATGQSGDDAASGTAQQNQAADENQADVSNETTASVNISQEQKTEIRQVIVESDVEPVDVDFDVSVGVAVPTTVTLAPLPPRVIEIVPQYEGYRYFVLADGRVIIVEPDTLEIVYILVV